MSLPLRALFIALIVVAVSPASTILTCGFNGAALSSTGCYSLQSFSYTETIDWQAAYGTANAANGHATTHTATASSPWVAPATSSGLVIGAMAASGTIARVDNFAKVVINTGWKLASNPDTGYADWQAYPGTFDAPPGGSTGWPGDHLLSAGGGAAGLALQFDRGISGAMFRISTATSGDVNATVAAYSILNPTALDMPLMTYTIHATADGGTPAPGGPCATLYDPRRVTPLPCNTAPYIGVNTGAYNIRTLVISTPGSAGALYIDTLYLSGAFDPEVPEPGTFALTGIVGALALLCRRRILRGKRS